MKVWDRAGSKKERDQTRNPVFYDVPLILHLHLGLAQQNLS